MGNDARPDWKVGSPTQNGMQSYDNLSRMAGNIAAGLATVMLSDDEVVTRSIRLARMIDAALKAS